MERPSKRSRTGRSPFQDDDDDDQDADELEFQPQEVNLRRDPGYKLQRSRAFAAFKLKSAFEAIFEKYEKDFTGVADEINLRTGEVVVDNGHLESLQDPSTEEDGSEGGSDTEGKGTKNPVSKQSLPSTRGPLSFNRSRSGWPGMPPTMMMPGFGSGLLGLAPRPFEPLGFATNSIEPAWRTPEMPPPADENPLLPWNTRPAGQNAAAPKRLPPPAAPRYDSDEDDILQTATVELRGNPMTKPAEMRQASPNSNTDPASSGMEISASSTPSTHETSFSATTSSTAATSLPSPSVTPSRVVSLRQEKESVANVSRAPVGATATSTGETEELSVDALGERIEKQLQADMLAQTKPQKPKDRTPGAMVRSAPSGNTVVVAADPNRDNNAKTKPGRGRPRLSKAGKGQENSPEESEAPATQNKKPKSSSLPSSPTPRSALLSSPERCSSNRLQRLSESHESKLSFDTRMARKPRIQTIVVEIMAMKTKREKPLCTVEDNVVEVLSPAVTPQVSPERTLRTDATELGNTALEPKTRGEKSRKTPQGVNLDGGIATPPPSQTAEHPVDSDSMTTGTVKLDLRDVFSPLHSFSNEDERSTPDRHEEQPITKSIIKSAQNATLLEAPKAASMPEDAVLVNLEATASAEPEATPTRKLRSSDRKEKENTRQNKRKYLTEEDPTNNNKTETTLDHPGTTKPSSSEKPSARRDKQKESQAVLPKSPTPSTKAPKPEVEEVASASAQSSNDHHHHQEEEPLTTPKKRLRTPRKPQTPTTGTRTRNLPPSSSSSSSSTRKPLISLVPDDSDDELALSLEDFLATPRSSSRNPNQLLFSSDFSYTPYGGSASLRRSLPQLLGTAGANVWRGYDEAQLQTPTANRRGYRLGGSGSDGRGGTGRRSFLYRDGRGESGHRSQEGSGATQDVGHQSSSPLGAKFAHLPTPEGTPRQCGKDGYRCGRDFCFACL